MTSGGTRQRITVRVRGRNGPGGGGRRLPEPGTVARVEAFESFVSIALESEGLVVSEAVKFPVTKLVNKAIREEWQTHGFEVDLVAARADRLVLATVKSFFGSRGVVADHVIGQTGDVRGKKLYALLNDPVVRDAVVASAGERYGYEPAQIHLRLYVGRFAGPTVGEHERRIRQWCAEQHVGAGRIEVYSVTEVIRLVLPVVTRKQYRDHPVLVTMKALQAAGLLTIQVPDDPDDDRAI
jgi:hypothetical protein